MRAPIAARLVLTPTSFERNPVVAVPRVLEQPERVRVAGRRAADLEDDLLVAVVIEIGERHAVSLVQFAGA